MRDYCVVIRVNAGPQTGYGHVVRCTALAEGFKKVGIEPIFLTNGTHNVIGRSGFKSLLVNWNEDTTLDFYEDSHVLLDNGFHRADILIVDSYNICTEYLKEANRVFNMNVVMDDLGNFVNGTDVVLNGNIYSNKLIYPIEVVKLLIGKEYCLLKDSLVSIKDKPDTHKAVNNVLIMMGGSDVKNLTSIILQILMNKYPHIKYHVVIGQGNKNFDEKEYCNKCNVLVYRDPDNLYRLMSSVDVAISASGSTIYELLYLCIPTISISVVTNQELLSSMVKELNLAVCIDFKTDTFLNELIEAFTKIESQRNSFHNRCIGFIDGFGAIRAANAILNLYECNKK